MIDKSTLQFLTALSKNNAKEWFDENRKKYELAKGNLQDNIEQLIKSIGIFDADIAMLEVKECTFRINRDIRFAKDKTPYKTNMSGYFTKGGKKSDTAGYYIHIEPGKSFAAAGCWWPQPKQLAAIRQEIDYNFDKFKKISAHKKFKQTFAEGVSIKDTLSRPPKGYDDQNPAIEFLKLKSFVVYRQLTDEDLQDKNFVKMVSSIFSAAKPLVNFLNTPEY